MNSPRSDEAVGGFVFEFELVSGEIATRYVTHRYQVQLPDFQIICCYWFLRVLFVSEGIAVGFAVLAHSFSIMVISYVPWYLVEQAPHGQS